jgi:hypothetical protein
MELTVITIVKVVIYVHKIVGSLAYHRYSAVRLQETTLALGGNHLWSASERSRHR